MGDGAFGILRESRSRLHDAVVQVGAGAPAERVLGPSPHRLQVHQHSGISPLHLRRRSSHPRSVPAILRPSRLNRQQQQPTPTKTTDQPTPSTTITTTTLNSSIACTVNNSWEGRKVPRFGTGENWTSSESSKQKYCKLVKIEEDCSVGVCLFRF